MEKPIIIAQSPVAHQPVADGWGHWPRYCNMVLGLWLFLSAFAWVHTPGNRINTCLVGLFMVIAATMAAGASPLRRLTGVLAGWLAFTTLLVYPARPATFWNNLILAGVVLLVSCIPSAGELPLD